MIAAGIATASAAAPAPSGRPVKIAIGCLDQARVRIVAILGAKRVQSRAAFENAAFRASFSTRSSNTRSEGLETFADGKILPQSETDGLMIKLDENVTLQAFGPRTGGEPAGTGTRCPAQSRQSQERNVSGDRKVVVCKIQNAGKLEAPTSRAAPVRGAAKDAALDGTCGTPHLALT
ncbi:MAG TPA: hypothetical protein VKB87_07320 [Myxococcaceae bacterium]|nr:hypothetical protein [Myxococcaceae bacterium]